MDDNNMKVKYHGSFFMKERLVLSCLSRKTVQFVNVMKKDGSSGPEGVNNYA